MDISIEIEETPNPKALKFILNHPVKKDGKVTFQNAEECVQPMEKDLFAIPGVAQIHYFDNVITVSQSGERDWADLVHEVKAVIDTRLPIHDPNLVTEVTAVRNRSHLSPEMLRIDEILDRTVRSGLQADGGDLELISYEDSVLTVRFQGACGSCPSSTMGTLYAIEGILQQEFDPAIQVRPQAM
ncbi:MAG: NifU family protein [Bdellovibrionales bacterium]